MITKPRALAALLLAMALLGANSVPAAAADRSWSVVHGSSTATGSTTISRSGPFPWSPATYELAGQLLTNGSCSAVWLSHGVLPGLGSEPVRIASTCGSDPVPVTHSGRSDQTFGIRAAVWLQVCAGVHDRTACGRAVPVD